MQNLQQQPVVSELEQLQQQLALQQMEQMGGYQPDIMPELQNLDNVNHFDEVKKEVQKVDRYLSDKLHEIQVKYKNIWGAVMILAGAFMCLFGRALLGYAIFIAATGFGFVGGLALTFKGFDFFKIEQPSNTVFYVILGTWGLIGLLLGFCFYKMQKYGVILLSMVAGVLCAHIVLTALIVRSEPVYWGVVAGAGLLSCGLSCYCQNNIRIFLTSLIGSFLFVRGVAAYAGGFPQPEEMKYYTFSTFPKAFYAYVAGFILLLVASVFFQRSQLKDVKQKKAQQQQSNVKVQAVNSGDMENSYHQLNGTNNGKPN